MNLSQYQIVDFEPHIGYFTMKRLPSPAPQIVNFDGVTTMINLRSILLPTQPAFHKKLNIGRGILIALALSVMLISSGFPGEFFGTIRADGKALPKGVKLDITSPAKTYSTETDAYGSYRLYVAEKGKCDLKIYYKGKTPAFTVFSYPKSTRYDFTIEKKDSLFVIKRK